MHTSLNRRRKKAENVFISHTHKFFIASSAIGFICLIIHCIYLITIKPNIRCQYILIVYTNSHQVISILYRFGII